MKAYRSSSFMFEGFVDFDAAEDEWDPSEMTKAAGGDEAEEEYAAKP